ncbi:carboxypeptidase-like protein [Maribacter vaceletii]|uniref:Carboxypeptidase-like protein n=1 Tax=Maribacter vaceletii TaxID=1206816 RepID=A0A495EBH2_9FLAO|nr:carboxypeptidase-like regulatory domain-containing protein [Maribacter vaceletii]RKR14234.1 carboxypeptidase-like protein [Maribacter vaceletii]
MLTPKKTFEFCIFLYFVFTLSSCFGQEKTIKLNGKVQSISNDVLFVLIVNKNSKKSTITDSLGQFTIEVKLKDSLRFTAVQYQTKEISITSKIFLEKLLVVDLVDNVINLNEVTVTPYNLTGKIDLDIERLAIAPSVTSSVLGLPNADVEKMSQSERLLIEADRGKYMRFYVIALTINTHKILNKLSGRTDRMKGMVARDKNMEIEKEIIAKFSKKTMSESFKIPEEKIDGFLTFCLSQTDFSELSKATNTEEIWEYLKLKSIAFKEQGFIKKE